MDGTSNIAQIIIAVATLVTAIGALVTGVVNAMRITHVSGNVQKIELATNSMKDQLVASTAKASMAEGTAVGLKQGRDEHLSDKDEPVKVEVTNTPLATTDSRRPKI